MKIEINNADKTIRLLEPTSIHKLSKLMKRKFPNNYKEYKIIGYRDHICMPLYYPYISITTSGKKIVSNSDLNLLELEDEK